jgi:serine/threonine protein kinase
MAGALEPRRLETGVMELASARELIGSRVSHYAILDLLGTGGMGEVYRARDEMLKRDVAVKVVRRQDGAHPDGRRLLAHEARALSRVNHPHIASIYDFLTESDRDYIIMEYVPGATLKDILESGSLPLRQVLRLGQQIVDGMSAVHAARVVHRDIKPSNIKVTETNQLKIVDFGLARVTCDAADASTTTVSAGSLAGTVPYMAPERLLDGEGDERGDVYSVGTVLYEMATGKPAFAQRQLAPLIDAILHEHVIPPARLNPQIPRSLGSVIERAMHRRPERRYQTGAELSQALASVAQRLPGEEPGVRERMQWFARCLDRLNL